MKNNYEEYCPKCEKLRTFKPYNGLVGYESLTCSSCGFDANDTTIQDLTKLYKDLSGDSGEERSEEEISEDENLDESEGMFPL
jgi:hypothetical protein